MLLIEGRAYKRCHHCHQLKRQERTVYLNGKYWCSKSHYNAYYRKEVTNGHARPLSTGRT
jgi:hypothetical protein